MTAFIFMLTRNDVTVQNALDVLEEVKDTGLRCIGCKDIGLKTEQYAELFDRARKYGMMSFLEVVTYNMEEHFRGVDLALKAHVDNLIGGMPQYIKKTLEYLSSKKSKLKFFPYVGQVSGHPCILQGSSDSIIKIGKEAESLGVDGINLLLYRYVGDQKALLDRATKEFKVPLIVAGSINTFEQIEELKRRGVWAFTIGGAIFEKRFIRKGKIRDQITAVLSKL